MMFCVWRIHVVCMLCLICGKFKAIHIFIANLCGAFWLKTLHQSQNNHTKKYNKMDCLDGKTPITILSNKLSKTYIGILTTSRLRKYISNRNCECFFSWTTFLKSVYSIVRKEHDVEFLQHVKIEWNFPLA